MCHIVIEYRLFDHIRCASQQKKHKAACCAPEKWTRYLAPDNTTAAYFPQTFCSNCQVAGFKVKAAEASIAELTKNLGNNNLGAKDMKGSLARMANAEVKRLAKAKAKPSIFISRKSAAPKKALKIVTKPEHLVHQTTKGRVGKASTEPKVIAVPAKKAPSGPLLEELLEFMTVN